MTRSSRFDRASSSGYLWRAPPLRAPGGIEPEDARSLFEQLARIASENVSVLIQGETATGKELVAEAIHEASDRAKKPFVVIDCTNIPTQLAESTLFGHEKGSFTGADSKRISPFLEAHGGTVFLDDMGELPLDLQPKLLRALEQRKIKPVGSSRCESVDVRVIGSTSAWRSRATVAVWRTLARRSVTASTSVPTR